MISARAKNGLVVASSSAHPYSLSDGTHVPGNRDLYKKIAVNVNHSKSRYLKPGIEVVTMKFELPEAGLRALKEACSKVDVLIVSVILRDTLVQMGIRDQYPNALIGIPDEKRRLMVNKWSY